MSHSSNDNNVCCIVAKVVGSAEEVARFRILVKPFCHTVPEGSTTLAVLHKNYFNPRQQAGRKAGGGGGGRGGAAVPTSSPQPPQPSTEIHFIFDDDPQQQQQQQQQQPPLDAVLILYDATSINSVDDAADAADNVEQQLLSFVMFELSGSQAADAEVNRSEMSSHVVASPEYCGQVIASSDEPPPLSPLSATASQSNKTRKQNERLVDQICTLVADCRHFPKHVLWDGQSLTATARKCIRRSFWLLDRDSDNALNDSELVHFLHAVYGAYSSDDIAEIKSFVQEIIDRQVADGEDPESAKRALLTGDGGHITLLGLFGICHVMVSEARHKLVWRLFAAHGVEADGRPFRDAEIERAATGAAATREGVQRDYGHEEDEEEDGESKLHLSETGVNFLASLYMTRPRQSPRDLFLFTPDCPWRTIYGLPNAEELNIAVAEFIQCWRFMAQVDPPTVAIFAKYWSFQGDLASLFTAHKMRRFRPRPFPLAESAIPPAAMFLVLGAGNCGKTTLMQHVAHPRHLFGGGDGDDDDHNSRIHHTPGRSVAILPVHAIAGSHDNNNRHHTSSSPHSSRHREVCVALRELEDSEVEEVLADRAFMETIDGVLLCYDGSDPYSFGFVASILPKLCGSGGARGHKQQQHHREPQLPVLVVLCKADLPLEDQLGLVHGPELTCRAHGLPWPPTIVSAYNRNLPAAATMETTTASPNSSSSSSSAVMINEIDKIPMILAELIVRPDVLTEVARQQTNGGGGATSGGSIGFGRIVKRTVVVGAVVFGAYSAASYLERRFHWLKYFPALQSAAKEFKAIMNKVVPPAWREKCLGLVDRIREDAPVVLGRVSASVASLLHRKSDNHKSSTQQSK